MKHKIIKYSVSVLLAVLMIFQVFGAALSSFADDTKNLYSEEEAPDGVYYKGGVFQKGTKYYASNLCDVSGAERVYAGILDCDRGGAVPYFEFFAPDGTFICDVFASDANIEPISRYFAIVSAPIPEGASGVRVNFRIIAGFIPAITINPFTYEEYIKMTGSERNFVRKDSPLYQKKILFCGDSICEAYVEKEDPRYSQIAGWAGRIGTYNDMDFVNKGLGGAAFSYFNPEKNPKYLILTQLKEYESEAQSFDLVLLHGGVNDMWDKATIGEISESYDPDDFDMETFAGAMETTFCYAKKTYTNAAIGFLINFQTHSGYGYLGSHHEMKKYWEVAKQICDKWEIPYLDMFNEAPFKTMKIPTDHGGDGIHPIYEGYEMLYPHIEKFTESLVALIPSDTKDPPDDKGDEGGEVVVDPPVDDKDDKDKDKDEPDDPPADNDGNDNNGKGSGFKKALPFIIGGAVIAVGAVGAGAIAVKKKKGRKGNN